MRLIDADALKENLLGEWYVESNETIFNHVFDLIDNSTTVERPQGEWIKDNDIFKFMKCSNCDELAEWLDGGSQFLSNFCPNCGADMRGGAEC